jgi:DNA-binding protein Fis
MTEAVKDLVTQKLSEWVISSLKEHANSLVEEYFENEPGENKDEMYNKIIAKVKYRL